MRLHLHRNRHFGGNWRLLLARSAKPSPAQRALTARKRLSPSNSTTRSFAPEVNIAPRTSDDLFGQFGQTWTIWTDTFESGDSGGRVSCLNTAPCRMHTIPLLNSLSIQTQSERRSRRQRTWSSTYAATHCAPFCPGDAGGGLGGGGRPLLRMGGTLQAWQRGRPAEGVDFGCDCFVTDRRSGAHAL